MTSPHEILNPSQLAEPFGFSHVVIAAHGRTVFLGGQAAHDADGEIASDDIVEQFGAACSNVMTALRAAGAEAGHLVSLHIYVTDARAYRRHLEQIGASYRAAFGNHYPAISLFEIKGLFDPAAKVELVGVAVIPDDYSGTERGR